MASGNQPTGITFDTREFDRALKEYVKLSSRDEAEILNRKALRIAHGALANTKKAERSAIEDLGLRTASVKEYTSEKTKKKKVKRKFDFAENEAIGKYLGARSKAGRSSGQSFENRKAIAKAARKWIAAKLRSIGFLRSGWIVSIKKLSSLVGEAYQRPADVVSRSANLGQCTPAKPGPNPFALIENNATLGVRWNDSKARAKGQELATEGLRKAFHAETQAMQKYIADKLQKTANKFIPPKTSTK